MTNRNIFLLLGSNSGDRLSHMRTAVDLIEKKIGNVIARSKIYETEPWGKLDQPHFLNQIVKIESHLFPNELLIKTQSIEQSLGRIRREKWGERSIDIDIIYFEDKTINTSDLVIPHPHIAERRFVLIPLTEVSPEFIHPVLKKSNNELLKECNDPLEVKEFKG